jgi:RimJ/RimL family protein N-acetyltransferase
MRTIDDHERFRGERILLRLVTEADCTEGYVAWLADPVVNRYLETRWREHDLAGILGFVQAMRADECNYLFAICESEDGRHLGNLKIGPINPYHAYADISYFLGDRAVWGRGYASEAIRLATAIGFERLGLHRIQAGVYAGNLASSKALLKNGYREEGVFREQFRGDAGWEDHYWFGLLAEDWRQAKP